MVSFEAHPFVAASAGALCIVSTFDSKSVFVSHFLALAFLGRHQGAFHGVVAGAPPRLNCAIVANEL